VIWVRRLLLFISAMMFLELFFFAVLSPLLPSLKHELGLSTAQAGLLVAMYALGGLVGAVPAVMIVVRAGVKLREGDAGPARRLLVRFPR